MKTALKILLTLLLPFSALAQYDDGSSNETVDTVEIVELFDGAIKYLISNQEKTTIEEKQYRGEWPVFMELTKPYFVLGKRRKVRDSNCFTVAAIHNFLSEMYIADTTLTKLKPTLKLAFDEIQSYAVGNKYNFWKQLPPNRKLKLLGNPKPLPLVRRPTNYPLRSRLINNAANVPEDADDTSLGNLAKYYHNQIFRESDSLLSYRTFDMYADHHDRKNKNWYNLFMHETKSTGAFMTWLYPEHKMWFPNPVQPFINNLFIFFPGSPATPRAYEPWVPFGANDVDAVVNANILTYLAASGQLHRSQVKDAAVRMITGRVDKNMWNVAGIYYPNACHLHYVVARAYAAGVVDLNIAAEKVLSHLIESQQPDGSFVSRAWLNNADSVQTTAYALHALLDLKKTTIEVPDKTIHSAVSFLQNKALRNGEGVYWNGGVYFSGGTVLRNLLIWHADAYTTALVAKCFQSYKEQFTETN